jgi:hypothetical protein
LNGKDYVTRSSMVSTSQQILLGWSNKEDKVDRACGAYGRQKGNTRFWLGNLRERGRLEDLGVDGKILKWIIQK